MKPIKPILGEAKVEMETGRIISVKIPAFVENALMWDTEEIIEVEIRPVRRKKP